MELILVSWVARNNDPYTRNRALAYVRDQQGQLIEGPTLSLMFSTESAYKNNFGRAIFFYNKASHQGDLTNLAIAEELRDEIHKRAPDMPIDLICWDYPNPTDHKAIFSFLREQMPQLRQAHPQATLVINTSPGTPSMHTIWVLMAETGFIQAPYDIIQIQRRGSTRFVSPISVGIESFYQVYEKLRLHQPTQQHGIFWDPSRFVSPPLKQVYREARRFARLNVPILLLGERGTGKTTLASWIRYHSPFRQPKKDTDWASVACGMYSSETMRAELFGYVKGAFTGAVAEHPGMLAHADQDTLFLDEIGDLSSELQRLLIRAIEEKRYMPLGAMLPKHSQFRLITASNQPWSLLSQRLAPDFLDRISLLTLTLPGLREIPDDLPWLWQEVLGVAAKRSQQPLPSLSDAAHAAIVEGLQRHPLPGNLRDLFRVAYRLLAFATPNDGDEASQPREALQALERPGYEWGPTAEEESAPVVDTLHRERQIAALFSQGKVFPQALLSEEEPLETSALFHALKRYLAIELRREAQRQDISPEMLCDVTERSLRKWRLYALPGENGDE